MTKLNILVIALLLLSMVGCGSGDSVTGPDTSDQVQTNETAQKPDVPGDPDGTLGGPGTPGDPEGTHGGPH